MGSITLIGGAISCIFAFSVSSDRSNIVGSWKFADGGKREYDVDRVFN